MSYIVQEEDGTSKFTLEEGGGAVLTEETAAITPIVVSGSQNLGASDYIEGVTVDLELTQVANSGLGATGVDGVVNFYGANTSIETVGVAGTAGFFGTKTAGSGDQLSAGVTGVQGTAYTDSSSTGDVSDVTGGWFQAILNAATQLSHAASAVRAYATAGAASGGTPSVRSLTALYAKLATSGRTISEGHGLQVDSPTGPSYFSTIYGIRVQTQTGAGTSYGISVEGGNNQLIAGAAAEVPLVLKGAASQTGNLLEFRNSAGTLLHYFDSAGVFH